MLGQVLVARARQLEKCSLSAVHRQTLPKFCSSRFFGRWTSDHGHAVVPITGGRAQSEWERIQTTIYKMSQASPPTIAATRISSGQPCPQLPGQTFMMTTACT